MSYLLLNDAFDVIFWVAPTIFGIIFAIGFISVIVRIVKGAKSIGRLSKSVEDTIVENFNQAKAEAEEQKNPYITCDYCGSANEKTNKSCTSCGAALKAKKR